MGSKITQLPNNPNPAGTALLEIVSDPVGTPVNENTSISQLATSIAGVADTLVYKGTIDCSTNPNYPAADAGHIYIASVAGKIGGASGIVVEAGDLFVCKTDGTSSGTQAAVGANWDVIQTNIAYTPEDVANKDTDGTLAADSDTKYASQKATKTYVDTAVAGVGGGITELTGDVTAGPGSGSQGAAIANDAVTNTKLANMANATIKGRNTAGTGDPEDVTMAQLAALIKSSLGFEFTVAVSDESTAITTGAAKITFYFPVAVNITGVSAGLSTQSSSGAITIDVNKGGTTIFSTNPTIDANEDTSHTAATPAALTSSPTAFALTDKVTIDIDGAGTGAKGLKVSFTGTRQ
jgi:hypothetical protein